MKRAMVNTFLETSKKIQNFRLLGNYFTRHPEFAEEILPEKPVFGRSGLFRGDDIPVYGAAPPAGTVFLPKTGRF
jgi:hypothetical protein